MTKTLLELKNIVKTYPSVRALAGVSMSFLKGEVHAIVGENGAGKSTLIKTVSGAIVADSGEIVIDGQSYEQLTPRQAKDLGIEVIYQEFNLVDSLSAAENIFLGEKYGRLVNFNLLNKMAKEIFQQFNVDIDPRTIVSKLSPAHKQIVEIAKAITKDVKILIMDEPTAPLTVGEVDSLFRIISNLKDQGITVIYISHRIDEIFQICDRISILRDGAYISTKNVKDTNRQELIRLMVGRDVKDSYFDHSHSQDEVALEVKNFSSEIIHDISFKVKKGEILGFSGLVGAGRTELMRLVFGLDEKDAGQVYKSGKMIQIRSPRDAMLNGIGLIPEDRKEHGVFLDMSVDWNICICVLREISKLLVVDKKQEKTLGNEYLKKLSIKTPSLNQLVRNLSGGNQQKIALAKILATNSEIIIFDEPTRGIDVGAREEIYNLMMELVQLGKSIIMISSDMEELLGMSDRILVISNGYLAGEVLKNNYNQDYILELASTY